MLSKNAMALNPKTMEEHRDYLYKIVRLKLRYDLRSSKCTLAAMRQHLQARFFSVRIG